MRTEYREEPCKAALNHVKGMPFDWSLNPYMGCVHRCTFCYVRAFELRADRPADERYGTSIRVKVNIAEVLRAQLARPSWDGRPIAIGAATDPYQPAEGRYRLTRACLEVLRDAAQPFSLDHARPADRARRGAARRGLSPGRRLGDVLGADDRRRGLAHRPSRAPRLRGSGCARCACSSTPACGPPSAWRPSSPASRTIRGRSSASSRRRARQAPAASGRTCSTSSRARASTSSTCLARDWPELLPHYERLYARRAYLAAAEAEPARAHVRTLARRHGIRDRRPEPLRPPPRPEQLSLLPAV